MSGGLHLEGILQLITLSNVLEYQRSCKRGDHLQRLVGRGGLLAQRLKTAAQ